MTHLYTFELEEIPSAMAAYNDKLLIGVGNSLRLYEFGRSKLLLKGIRNGFGSIINGIHS